MKKLFTVSVLFFIACTVNAQNVGGDLTIAPYAGVTFATYSSDQDVSFDSRTSFAAGAILNYYFSDRLSLRSGLSYLPLGVEDDLGNTDRLNYIAIPANAAYHFGSRRNWYLNFGFSALILASANGELQDGTEIDLDDVIKSTDFGLNLGIGYKFNLDERTQLFGEFQTYNGFVDIIDVPEVEQELRNVGASINIGIIFDL
jgi:opacity protein-like surface antigen